MGASEVCHGTGNVLLSVPDPRGKRSYRSQDGSEVEPDFENYICCGLVEYHDDVLGGGRGKDGDGALG